MKIKIELINEELPKDEIIKVGGEINEDNPIIDLVKMIGVKKDREFVLKIE